MLQWLRLTVWLLLSAVVSGTEVECDVDRYDYRCWNSTTHSFDNCWSCAIKNQQTTDNELSIAPKHRNGFAADVEVVRFSGGDVTKMQKVINKNTNKQILNVELERTKTRVLNAQFFGNATQNLINLRSYENDNLSVEASAFQNFAALEVLNLSFNRISSIPPDAFLGLNKLFRLDLRSNSLTAINEALFDDLGNLEELDLSWNQLTEVADTAFENLPNLKQLYLNRNKIEIVTRRMFQHNQQLEQIHLHNNQIKVIQSGSFAHLHKLSRLDLSGNKCIDSNFRNTNPEEISAALTACRPTICLIPFIPNGYIVSIEDNIPQIIGDSSEEYNPVKVVCLPSFSLFHERTNQTANECQDKVWKDEKWAECHRVCIHKQISGLTIFASCERHGRVFPCSGHLLPGTKATIRCQIGYQKPEGSINSQLTCRQNGKWSHEAFQCQPISGSSIPQSGVKCPHQPISGLSINAFCNHQGQELNCTGDQLPGTEASIECHFGYQMPPTAADLKLTCLTTGNWSHEALKCEPICGKITSHSTSLFINGKNVNVTEAPWHVGIHENGEQICGGTIVTERVVITAAHCFSQETMFVHTFDVKSFKVAAGKYKRGLDEEETLRTQIRDVEDVKIPTRYDGTISHKADIAKVIVKGHFEYQPHIAPACVKFVKTEAEKYPKNETYALVAGWGRNKNLQSSETLQAIHIPVEDWATCQSKEPYDFKGKVIADKICAGSVDGDYSVLACKGDSGGGLLIPQMVAGEKRYFLQGVVSNSRQTFTCDNTFYTLFTNVQFYKEFLSEGIEKDAALWDEMITITPPVTVTPPVTQPTPVEKTWYLGLF